MPVIGVIASSEQEALDYLEAMAPWGIESLLLIPGATLSVEETLERIHGLLVTGGEDIDPVHYGHELGPGVCLELNPARDALELPLLRAALEWDLPVLGLGRGLQALNVAAGGSLLQDIPDHRQLRDDGEWESAYHRIWVSPGSKLAAAIGSGGRVRVNSLHHQGLREAQKSPRLLASAYSLEDRVIEALESPYHRWVLAVQFHPEWRRQLPRQFQRLFEFFAERSAEYAKDMAELIPPPV